MMVIKHLDGIEEISPCFVSDVVVLRLTRRFNLELFWILFAAQKHFSDRHFVRIKGIQ